MKDSSEADVNSYSLADYVKPLYDDMNTVTPLIINGGMRYDVCEKYDIAVSIADVSNLTIEMAVNHTCICEKESERLLEMYISVIQALAQQLM